MIDIPHKVGKLEFELETTLRKHAVDIQTKLSGYGKREIPEILEASFNDTGIEQSVAVIDRVEIDLGEITFEEFNERFLSLFRERFNEKLSELNLKDQLSQPEGVRVFDREIAETEVLKEFLLTGKIPWYAADSPPDLEAVFSSLIETGTESLFRFIKQNIFSDQFMQRLVYQFSADLISRLLGFLLKDKYDEAYLFISQIIQLAEGSPALKSRLYDPEFIKLLLLFEAIRIPEDSDLIVVRKSMLVGFSKKLQLDYVSFLKLLIKEIEESEKSPAVVIDDKVKADIEVLISDTEKTVDLIAETKKVEETKVKTKEVIKSEVTEADLKKPEDVKVEEEELSFYVSNCGLVLLHPFLSELFRKTGLTEKNEFIDEPSVHRAIHLSQYAVFGNSVRPEYLLVLNKIMCGYPLEKSIPIRIHLSRREKWEATRMVSAAVQHWSALKNTSTKAFRTTFLQRNGLLKQTETGWKLFVEREEFDVLIDRIPWGYHNIKLPWMDKMIEVEW